MKSIRTMLAVLVVVCSFPALAEDTAEPTLKEQLQRAYDQSQKALDKNNVDGYMALFADDYSTIAAGYKVTREQARALAEATVKRPKRASITTVIDKVEEVEVTVDGDKRTETVATVFQTIENEAVDREGKTVKKSLKLTFRDTVVKNGDSWQVQLRVPQ